MTRVVLNPGTPLSDGRRRQAGRGFWFPSPVSEGVTTASSTRATATATADAATHTKGAWTQVVAATTTEVTMVTICLTVATNANATDTSTLLDIGIGAAASEVVIVPNLAFGYRGLFDRYDIPVTIPAGSRIAIRCQSAVTVKTAAIVMTLGKLPFGRRAANHVVAIGADTATSHGVSLAIPGAINTKGAWTEITSSTTEPFGALIIGEQGASDTVFTAGTGLLDIGIGASGSETVLSGFGDLSYSINGNEFWSPHGDRNYPADVPMGSRLSARFATTNLANSIDVILYGAPRQ